METRACFSLRDFYGGSIHARLAAAKALSPHLAGELAPGAPLARMLARAVILEKELARSMAALDLGTLCTLCAARGGGGCCSSFMAGENDVPQLLLNLLAGVAVAAVRDDAECCFLGSTGCLLLFKPMFCLNYNCMRISQSAGPERLQSLEQDAGRLLQQQYGLEQLLLELLRKQGRLRD